MEFVTHDSVHGSMVSMYEQNSSGLEIANGQAPAMLSGQIILLSAAQNKLYGSICIGCCSCIVNDVSSDTNIVRS